ncbi:pyridoxamine 5'-phosphate oxidase [Christiangramia sabulilitoris]|uniref:Pyridoxine/pyridoxamine 5'-phosphate oxidase n=1 Tax=Christiangramia sabulilitoris TaxID=2583991 RepID=A0A550I5Q5_9FLAO|nr:pyridoxamine 5'-phosphate oxidase [Christiangramia sabulilitoris]TRO66303.1 pyridoxamine 5'-phosphate oxidase [Christiangramia sabulilitoris]
MQKDLKSYRKSYEKGELLESDIPGDPYELFQSWFQLADEAETVEEANAMNIATVGKDMAPVSRIVLLKGYSKDGFIFYTNYKSQKGKALSENPKCCLSFFWPSLEKQVIIHGEATKLSPEESEDYFHSRPRGSQLGAKASDQSSKIPSREFLEGKIKSLEEKYKGEEIPKPGDWGGYKVKPLKIEFWQGRKSRLHDRILFTSTSQNNWIIERLAP